MNFQPVLPSLVPEFLFVLFEEKTLKHFSWFLPIYLIHQEFGIWFKLMPFDMVHICIQGVCAS